MRSGLLAMQRGCRVIPMALAFAIATAVGIVPRPTPGAAASVGGDSLYVMAGGRRRMVVKAAYPTCTSRKIH